MIINITGRGTTVQDSFKELAEIKLKKLDRFFDDDVTANVTVTNEGGRETVEVTINADNMVFRSERTSRDRRDSLDSVVDTVFRQIVRNKDKLKTRLRRQAFEPTMDSDFVGTIEEEYKIVRSKQFELKPMAVEEAVLQMNMLGHEFFMFLNADTEDISVVYKRADGNYGLIEPS